MTVYHLILHVNHRDTLPAVYLLPALHHIRPQYPPHNDSHLQCPRLLTALWADGAPASKENSIKDSEGGRGGWGFTVRLQPPAPSHLWASSGLRGRASHEIWRMRGWGALGWWVLRSLYTILVFIHKSEGSKGNARSWQGTVQLPPPLSVSDLTGYATLGEPGVRKQCGAIWEKSKHNSGRAALQVM